MGKAEQASAGTAGRVPLFQGGQPLLYPRYSSIEELLKIGKGQPPTADDVNDAEEAPTDRRPSKKQKRAQAAQQSNGDGQPAAAKGFSIVGEDGLTYKQRRQMRRAAERAAKAEAAEPTAAGANDAAADGEATGAGAAAPAPDTATPTPGADPAATAAAAPGIVKKEKKLKKRKGGEAGAGPEGGQPAAGSAAPTAAAAAGNGNADEAAHMRAVLGFTSNGGSAIKLASLVSAPAANAAAGTAGRPPAAEGGDGGADGEAAGGSSRKKQKKDKKAAKDKGGEAAKEKAQAEAEVEGGKTSVPAPATPEVVNINAIAGTGNVAAAKAAATGGKATGSKPGRKSQGGPTATVSGNKVFSFDFKVDAAVEAETEARLAKLMALDSTKDGFVPRRVWVSGLPHEFDEETVREYWSYCGEVESMHLLTFPDSGNFNGTAFITFKTQEGYEAALACQGEMLEGRALRVEKCKAAAELKGKARASAGGPGGGAATGTDAPANAAGAHKGSGVAAGRVAGYPVAYVGNVSFEAGVEELQQLFTGAGAAPTKVRLHTDKATGRSKGYAHVHFAKDDDVDKAVTLDGTLFHGRKIRVSYAQPKPGES